MTINASRWTRQRHDHDHVDRHMSRATLPSLGYAKVLLLILLLKITLISRQFPQSSGMGTASYNDMLECPQSPELGDC